MMFCCSVIWEDYWDWKVDHNGDLVSRLVNHKKYIVGEWRFNIFARVKQYGEENEDEKSEVICKFDCSTVSV